MSRVIRFINQTITTRFNCIGPVATALLLTACGITTDSQLNDNTADAVTSSDVATANALYYDRRIPVDFYQEDSPGDVFVTVSHVKNTDLLVPSLRVGVPVYELSTNDFVEAVGWDEQAAQYLLLYDQLVDTSETKLYYQFTHVNPNSPELIHMARVFKADVLDRAGVDRSDEDGEYKGKITLATITAADVKFIIEYLWMFTLSNNYSNAIIESFTTETSSEFIHIMRQAELDFSNNESCDTISLYDISYTVPKDSGLIWRDKTPTRSFLAKLSDGQIIICD